MPSKKDIISSNLNDELWDLDTVVAIIETAKAEKNEKGKTMNLFAVKVDHGTNGNEFNTFINELAENIGSIEDGTRIQLMVQSGEHWYPIDFEINNGNVSAIIPEAGFSPSTSSATVQILNAFPHAEIYRFYPDNVTIDGRGRSLMIQADDQTDISQQTIELK